MTLEAVKTRTLQATIWDCDRFQENMFLGSVMIPLENINLSKETTRWYPLKNFDRLSRHWGAIISFLSEKSSMPYNEMERTSKNKRTNVPGIDLEWFNQSGTD